MGQVIPSVKAPNLAREVVLGDGPAGRHPRPHREPRLRLRQRGHRRGGARRSCRATPRSGIAGGAESLSDVPILHSRRMARVLVEASRARGLGGRLRAFAQVRPRDLGPGGARDRRALHRPDHGPVGGEDGAGRTASPARSRTRSPTRATATPRPPWTTAGWPPELCPVLPAAALRAARSTRTTCSARDTSLEALAALPPVFDRQVRHGDRRATRRRSPTARRRCS